MTAAETATKPNPATVDARPYFERQMEDPESRAAYERAKAEIDFVDGVVNAVLDRSCELGISTCDLAEKALVSERRVRRLLAGHPDEVDLRTVAAVAAALGIELSVRAPAVRLAEQSVAEVS